MNQAEVKRKQIQFYSYALCMIVLLYFERLLGSNGLAYFVVGFVTVSFFLQFVSGVASDALGRMLRFRRKRDMYMNAHVVRKRIQNVFLIISILCFVLVMLLADVLATKVFGVPNAGLIIRILAPVLLLRMLVSFWQGYFQSYGSQLQTMFGCILRPVLYFLLGNAFCNKRLEYGLKVSALLKNDDFGGMYAAIGLAEAVIITELVIFVVLLVFYFMSDRKNDKSKSKEGRQSLESLSESLGSFARQAGPGIGMGLLGFFWLAIWLMFLESKEQIGVFGGMFMTLITFCALLMGARYFLIYAKVVHAVKGEHNRHIRDMMQIGLKYAWCFGILLCMLIAVLAPQLAHTFFAGNEIVVGFLQKGSLLLPAVMLLSYWILIHAVHKKYFTVFIVMVADLILFVLLSVFMKGRMEDKVSALMFAGIIALAVACIVLGMLTINTYRLQIEYIITFVLPLACVGMVGLLLMAATKLLTPHIGNEVCFYVCAVLGYVIYLVLLGVCRVFTEQDVNHLYGKFGKKCLSVIFK